MNAENQSKHYIKIYIKSAADLPKEEGDYFACRLGFKTVQSYRYGDQFWLKEVRWYLVEEPKSIWKQSIDPEKMNDVLGKWIKDR
jgi:hypothetical protein